LYYRLNAATLSIPALRDRPDFDWILEQLLKRHGDGELILSEAALAALKAHDWPGNIRELDNVVAVAAALAENGVVDIRELDNVVAVAAALAENGVVEIGDLPDHLLVNADTVGGSEAGAALSLMLATCDWNISETARRLGLDRSTVHRQIKRYSLKR
ncbi:hypothetical protein BMJ22_16410, partial [Sinorhizobium medicae]